MFVQVRFLIIPLLILIPAWVSAFEGYEHRLVGDAAFAVALHQSSSGVIGLMDPQLCRLLTKEHRDAFADCRSEAPTTLSYGHLSACIDHVAGAEALLAPLLGKDAMENPFQKLSDALSTDCNSAWAAMVMSRVNPSHFRSGAMAAFKISHTAAIAFASREKSPVRALVLNAGADHYLLDFMVPGHAFTLRASLSDAASLTEHDRINRQGRRFLIDVNAHRVKQVWEHLCSKDDLKAEQFRRLVLVGNVDGKKLFKSQDEVREACRLVAQFNGTAVDFFGDSYLLESRALVQRLYLVLVQAASILDILDVQPTDVNSASTIVQDSFQESWWDSSDAPMNQKVASVGHGAYINDVAYDKFDALPTEMSTRQFEPSRIQSYFDRVMIGTSLGWSTLSGESKLGRTTQTIELYVPIPKTKNWWFVAGPAWSWEKEGAIIIGGRGYELRVAHSPPKYPGFIFSGYYRNIPYDEPEEVAGFHLRRVGLRVDIGQTDIFGLYFSLYHDRSENKFGHIFNASGLSFGFSAHGPLLRVGRTIGSAFRLGK